MLSRLNKRGQIGVLSITVGLIMFWIMYAIILGDWINTWSQNLVTAGSLTGIEGFLASNLNLWVILGVHFSALVGAYYGQ